MPGRQIPEGYFWFGYQLVIKKRMNRYSQNKALVTGDENRTIHKSHTRDLDFFRSITIMSKLVPLYRANHCNSSLPIFQTTSYQTIISPPKHRPNFPFIVQCFYLLITNSYPVCTKTCPLMFALTI